MTGISVNNWTNGTFIKGAPEFVRQACSQLLPWSEVQGFDRQSASIGQTNA
ncbi:hypothetical protein ACPOL_4354 [Acidisarcina polymorpha]|uniref:Uncharacterized protein n=1 Tax=Acidisarcina polymorpha TaxID=2211140 RepID=A0A2Z5G3I7_9BACT|nr:hypothetical protein ACPOL_4354 [Acidisarcina polymorpha]